VTHVTFGDPSAWENPPNLGHGCGFSVGDFESTHTHTRPTHTRVPTRVCKPVTGPIWKDANFRGRLTALVVDEAHCIEEWGGLNF